MNLSDQAETVSETLTVTETNDEWVNEEFIIYSAFIPRETPEVTINRFNQQIAQYKARLQGKINKTCTYIYIYTDLALLNTYIAALSN